MNAIMRSQLVQMLVTQRVEMQSVVNRLWLCEELHEQEIEDAVASLDAVIQDWKELERDAELRYSLEDVEATWERLVAERNAIVHPLMARVQTRRASVS